MATRQYDLLIIAPEEFIESLRPLEVHKNNTGIATKLLHQDGDGHEIMRFFFSKKGDVVSEATYDRLFISFISRDTIPIYFDDWVLALVFACEACDSMPSLARR